MGGLLKGLMILGLFFIGLGFYFIFQAIASTTWDQVDGKVISIRMPASITGVASHATRRIEYSIVLTYEYQVDGVTYKNKRFALGSGDTVESGFNESSEAEQWLKDSDYRLNEKVTVYVNPGNPADTVLSAGINLGTIAPILLGLLFLGTGIGLRYAFSFEPKKA